MDRATGTLLATGGGAVPSTLGQVTTSAEIEEVRGLSCGALDLEFAAEEEAAREVHSQSDLYRWQACMHGIRSRRRAVTDKRWTLCLLDFDTIRA